MADGFVNKPTNASAVYSMATGPVLPSAAADVAPTFITKAQLPPPKTNLFTDSRHAMAAARMCADEYFYFSSDNVIDNDAHALDSVHEFLENSDG